MKYLYPLAMLLFLASCQKEEKKVIDRAKTDWAFYKLEGDVKSSSTKSWRVDAQLNKIKTEHEDMSTHDGEINFGEDGMLVSDKYYLNDLPFEETNYKGREKKQQTIQYIANAPGVKTEYSWDKAGNNTSITRRNADNTQIDRIEMKYQGKKLAEKKTFNAQNIVTDKITYMYDSKGNVNEENLYQGSESVQFKAVYKYDKKNRKISEARYNKNSEKHYETLFKYEGNNLAKKYTVNNKGEIEYSEDFTYDNKGKELTHTTFEKFDNSTTKDTYSYDAKGNKATWEIVKNGKLFMKALYTYDTHNNNIMIAVNDATGKEVDKREYIYEYDEKGNWTKRTVKINGVPQYIAERQIAYSDEE